MTDLEACVEAPGRAELVKQVREKINALGITYIYYQFISVTLYLPLKILSVRDYCWLVDGDSG